MALTTVVTDQMSREIAKLTVLWLLKLTTKQRFAIIKSTAKVSAISEVMNRWTNVALLKIP